MGDAYSTLCRLTIQLGSKSDFAELLDRSRVAYDNGWIDGAQWLNLRFSINLAKEFWTKPDQP